MTACLCDTNIWLTLAISGHTHHRPVREWLDTSVDQGSLLFCRATQQSLLRLLTRTAVLEAYGHPPLTNSEAWAVYEAFAADDRVAFREAEPAGLEQQWKDYALRPSASSKLWMDAYLAAFARAAGCRLVTTDTAFRQFRGLDLVLIGGAARVPGKRLVPARAPLRPHLS